MNPITLTINTSKTNETYLSLGEGNNKKEKLLVSKHHSSQQVLPLLEMLLTENNMTFQDISNIEVHIGPGSFTGIRIGAVVARMLGWLLDIPVNRKKATTPLKLDYGQNQWNT